MQQHNTACLLAHARSLRNTCMTVSIVGNLLPHCAGSSFSIEDLRSLQLAEMKTKMLVASLIKLGKLRVNLDKGQITGYFMQSA